MISNLRYGAEASLALELAGNRLLAHCEPPHGEPLVQVAEAIDRALAAPLEFPPLDRAAVPGDRVVLALADSVPRTATIVARAIKALLGAGVSAADISLVRSISDAPFACDPLAEVHREVRPDIVVHEHDPENRGQLSYLAAAADGEPIYINRLLHDADLVISIGCLRIDDSLGYHGVHSAIYPRFSDTATLGRFRSPKAINPAQRDRLRHAADEVGWLLGLHFTVQVVPGSRGEILHVLAGEAEAVFREGRRRCDQAWSCEVPERASLVVTTIEGGAAQQTWENVARALSAAARAVREDGAVAVCCELSQQLGPALQRVVGADDLDAALRDIGRRNPADSLAAAELVRALKRGKVYLLSQLDEELVEELGMMPVAPDQLSRLAARYDSCIVLSNGQYALPRLSGVDPEPQTATSSKPRK